ncbi:LrgB family protein [Pseudomonas sp. zfem003]|uniref:LrgB family protein n=1 Tax=Pseudomonas sp. zfem003 TaxID=3078198 RepID=UPI002928943E|nr:LrgB family protein [Pseudomonas sp. zfem003]MDU9399747.1 LrgB family protein [Pseudomonas sp. zfem003]
MSTDPMAWFWLALTLGGYLLSRWLYRCSGRYLLSPLILVPALLLAVAVPLHTGYAEYAGLTHWLMLLLGPATVAFAVPIWQQRALLARHWPALSLGGVPELTAVFVMITGVFGALAGSLLIRFLPLRSSLARGALFGVGAHGAGVSRAQEVGREEGTVAGLVMVLMGLLNLFAAPLLTHLL